MSKASRPDDESLRPEYDFTSMKGGVRGKYAGRLQRETIGIAASGELTCFVICPIGNRLGSVGTPDRQIWEDSIGVWEEVIKPACEGLGLSVIRADEISEAGDITDQIFRRLRDSHVVIADLTGANPNVMYELGLRHTTGKLTIQLGEEGRLPFDVNTIRTIMFRRTDAGLIAARRALVRGLGSGLEGRFTPVMATRTWLETPTLLEEESDSEEGVGVEEDEPGSLEIIADMETALTELTATIVAVGTVTQEIATALNGGTARLDEAGGPKASAAVRVHIANEVAGQLQDPVSRLEALGASFSESVRRCDPGIALVLKTLASEGLDEDVSAVFEAVREGSSAIVGGLEAAEGFRKILVDAASPTKDFRRVTRRIIGALGILIGMKSVIRSWIMHVEESARIRKGTTPSA